MDLPSGDHAQTEVDAGEGEGLPGWITGLRAPSDGGTITRAARSPLLRRVSTPRPSGAHIGISPPLSNVLGVPQVPVASRLTMPVSCEGAEAFFWKASDRPSGDQVARRFCALS